MTMVGFPQDVEEIYFSSKGIIANAKKDCILIDFTTSSPLLAKKIFEESSKHSLASLDAPVSGGDIGAKKGHCQLWLAVMKMSLNKLNQC